MTTSGDTPISFSELPSGSSRKPLVRNAFEAVTAALYPPRCVLCSAPTPGLSPFCSPCLAKLPAWSSPRCQRCGEQLPDPELDLCIPCGTQLRAVDRFLALGPYDGGWRVLLRALKFEREPAIGKAMGRLAVERLRAELANYSLDCVTYVPMHAAAQRARGFNQARVLANAISHELGIPLVRSLKKTRSTVPQAQLSAAERRANLKGAFRRLRCEGEHVLLVDDICTTGTTLEACAQALKQGGIRSVTALAVARA